MATPKPHGQSCPPEASTSVGAHIPAALPADKGPGELSSVGLLCESILDALNDAPNFPQSARIAIAARIGGILEIFADASGAAQATRRELSALKRELRKKKDQVQQLLRWKFGETSEKNPLGRGEADEVSDDEVDLDQIEAEEEKEAPIKGRRALRVSESVQIVKESHYPDINKCECGCNLKFAPGWVTTESHIVPEHVLLVEHTYYQGFCGRETCKQSGPVSRKTHRHIMKGCKLSLASVLTLVGQKYHEHSTMTRAGNRMRSNGLEHADSTLNRSIIHVAEKGFKKLYEEISNNVNSGPIVHADETPIKVRRQGEAKERGKGKCDKFYLYALLRDERKWNPDARPLVAFHFRTSRSADTISSLLSGTAIKILHIDGYAGYNCLFQDGDMLAARCWAHTRRYFEKAKESPLARRVLKLIAQMYTIEKATAFLTFAEREAIRMAKTLPLIDAIKIQIVQAQSLAAGYLATAINSDTPAHAHNRLLTSVVLTPDQRRVLAKAMCEKLAAAVGPVTFFLPTQGGNEWDRAGGPLEDAAGLAAFCEEMRACCPANVTLVELDAHINDAAFSEAVLTRFDEWVAQGVVRV